MKILAIMGSPRSSGNTSKILNIIKESAPKDYNIEIISVNNYNINGCMGCSHCQSDTENFACVQNDDCNMLLKKIIKADVVLYGTPLYGHNYSGQLKTFLDRHTPLFKFVSGKDKAVDEMEILSAIENKPVGLIVSCQGPVEYNTELIQMMFDKFCESSLSKCMGKYIFPFCKPNVKKSHYDKSKIQKIIDDIKKLSL